MCKYHPLFVLLVILCTTVPNTFAKNKPITISTIQNAIALVLTENPDLQTYHLKQLKAEQEHKKQQLSILPNISASFGGTYNIDRQTSALPGEIAGQPGETVSVQFGTTYNYNAGITSTMNLLDVPYFFNTQLTKVNKELEKAQTEAYKQKIIEQTTLYYFASLITKQSLNNHQQNVKLADKIVSMTEDRFAQGIVDLASVNLSKISANNVRQTANSNELMLEQYITQLKILIGLHVEDELQLDQELQLNHSPQFKNSDSLNIDKNLAIYTLQLQQSIADKKTKQAAFYPKVSINAYFGYQQLRDDLDLGFDDKDWTPYNYVGLTLSIPIFDSYKSIGSLEVSKANRQINQQIVESEVEKSKLNDAQLLGDYKNSLLQLTISEKNYGLFKQNSDLAYSKYQTGIMGIDNYYKAFEDYLNAENNYLNTLSTVYGHYAKILSRLQ
jgi:outer membrane protein TolC